MLGDCLTLYTKQFSHLRLSQPHSIATDPHINPDTLIRIEYRYLPSP